MKDLVDLLSAETKVDNAFPNGQFLIEGFKNPCRLDVSSDRGRLLVNLKDGIISKQISRENIANEIQILPIELNIRKQK